MPPGSPSFQTNLLSTKPALEIHTIENIDGGLVQNSDRIVLGILNNFAKLVGGSAGAAVTTAVSFSPLTSLPPSYAVGHVVLTTPVSTVTLSAWTRR
jgi:hypothetical protein